MSLWWIGPAAESVNLEAPRNPPNAKQRIPRLMSSVSNQRFVQVACGGGHAVALTHDGRLFSWGWNGFGQCGLGEDKAGASIPLPRVVGALAGRTVVTVACGAAHTACLVDTREFYGADGLSVYAWGAQQAGQLGFDETQKTKVQSFAKPNAVECLRNVAGFLAKDGSLSVVNAEGRQIKQPLSCGMAHTAVVSRDNNLWTWGANEHGQCGRSGDGKTIAPGQVRALEAHAKIAGVACGGAHTLALSVPGGVYAFGLNATGQLGDGSDHGKPTAIPVVVRLPPTVVCTAVACGEEVRASARAWPPAAEDPLRHTPLPWLPCLRPCCSPTPPVSSSSAPAPWPSTGLHRRCPRL